MLFRSYESQKQEVLQDGELLVETDMMTMFVYNKGGWYACSKYWVWIGKPDV